MTSGFAGQYAMPPVEAVVVVSLFMLGDSWVAVPSAL